MMSVCQAVFALYIAALGAVATYAGCDRLVSGHRLQGAIDLSFAALLCGLAAVLLTRMT